ncbi:hypothetical protein [Nitratidesulfovibrio sp. SRB-5]|uniref:hypothetical protein n=1 Tax=Nitratidesulfovibrio sp. SRB-5 TaxID=2872636 RepID=UPI001025D735|nr:hypothetical protein [Nitratidesulfovibrio sp. SRB-5]MBZ2172652.1 hypothetical protein [Nitratidesulfovibrio sp. SRB-5]RXF76525.1 hypothetical protein EKK70_11360 [Desulfovibrio sp. DS-1]
MTASTEHRPATRPTMAAAPNAPLRPAQDHADAGRGSVSASVALSAPCAKRTVAASSRQPLAATPEVFLAPRSNGAFFYFYYFCRAA